MTTKPEKIPAGNGENYVYTLDAGETGDWITLGLFGDRCVQAVITGGTATIEGSNDEGATKTVFTLNDPFGNPLTFSANGLKQVLETPRFVRPKATGAPAVVTIWARRTLR